MSDKKKEIVLANGFRIKGDVSVFSQQEHNRAQQHFPKKKKIIYSTDIDYDKAQREIIEKRKAENKKRLKEGIPEWREIKRKLPPVVDENEEKINKLKLYGIRGKIISIPMGGLNKKR